MSTSAAAGGRVVLVTGASSGIGRACALRLAEDGETVVLLARAAGPLEDVARQCRARGGTALVTPADVRDASQVAGAVELAVSTFGRLDGVISAAAVMAYGRVEDVPPEVFARVVETNLVGTAVVAHAVLPRFRAQGHGSLVVVGSVLGQITTPVMGAYVASKWGVRGLARVLEQETRDAPGVTVRIVSPGGVDTPIYQQAANFAGFVGRPPPPVDSPERVATAVIERLWGRRRSGGVGLANGVMRFGFTALPALFDLLVGPLVDRVAFSRTRTGPTQGNVMEAVPEREGTHGGFFSLR